MIPKVYFVEGVGKMLGEPLHCGLLDDMLPGSHDHQVTSLSESLKAVEST